MAAGGHVVVGDWQQGGARTEQRRYLLQALNRDLPHDLMGRDVPAGEDHQADDLQPVGLDHGVRL